MANIRLLFALCLATIGLILLLDVSTMTGVHVDGDPGAQQRRRPGKDWRILWDSIKNQNRAQGEVLKCLKELEAILDESDVQYDDFATREEIIELSRMGRMDRQGCTGSFVHKLHLSLEELKERKGFRGSNSLDRYKEEYGRKYLSVCLRNFTDELDFNGDTITSERKAYLEEIIHESENSIGWELMSYAYEDLENFHYPQEIVDFDRFIDEIDARNEQAKRTGSANLTQIFQDVIDSSAGTKNGDKIAPYTQFSNFEFLIKPKDTCASWFGNDSNDQSASAPITMIIVVKSAVNNYYNRSIIRETWAINGVKDSFKFKTFFIVGACDTRNPVPEALSQQNGGVWTPEDCRRAIDEEARQYDDLLQTSALDSYFNLTTKTAKMLHWVSVDCPSDFFLGIDDDYAFEVENLIKYTKRLALGGPSDESESSVDTRGALKKLARGQLFAGARHDHQIPVRAFFDKFRVSYQQYPFKIFPHYVTGGLVFMSHKTARTLHLASYFVRSFQFEDVYMGIIARKLGLKLHDDANFQCKREQYLAAEPIDPKSTNCIGVHRIKPDDLTDLWSHRRQL